MAEKEGSSACQKSDATTADFVSIEGPKIPNVDVKIQSGESPKLTKSMSLDAGESENVNRNAISRAGSFKRRSIRVLFYLYMCFFASSRIIFL